MGISMWTVGLVLMGVWGKAKASVVLRYVGQWFVCIGLYVGTWIE